MCVNLHANSQSPPGRHSHHNVMRNVFSTWWFEAKQNTPNTHNRLKSFRYLSGIVPVSPRQPPNTSCSHCGHFDQFVFIILQILLILIDILRIRCFVCPLWQKIGSEHSEHCNSGYSPNGNNSTLDNKLPISSTVFSFSSASICCRSVCIVFS